MIHLNFAYPVYKNKERGPYRTFNPVFLVPSALNEYMVIEIRDDGKAVTCNAEPDFVGIIFSDNALGVSEADIKRLAEEKE